MSKWEMVKLGEVCEGITDGSHNPPQGIEHSEYLMLSSKNVYNDFISLDAPRYLSESSFYIEDRRTKIRAGDVLLTIVGTIGRTAVVPENMPKFTLQRSVAVLRPNSKKVLSRYLMYVLMNIAPLLERSARGVAQKGIYLGQLGLIEISLPPLEIQKQIAKTLDTAAELLAMLKQQLAELDNLIKSTFYDMFGDPVENEKGWLVLPLREKLYVKHGFAFQGEYFSNEGEYILLTPGNFYEEGGYRDRGDKQKYYRGKIPQEYMLNKGDLLIAMTEQAPGLLGSPLFVPESNKFLHNQRLGLIMLKKYDISKLYIFHLFNHQNIRKLIHLQATGTKVRHTSPTKIEDLVVPLPPIELQNEFANIVTKIEEQKALVKKTIDETQHLFDSLMCEYFE